MLFASKKKIDTFFSRWKLFFFAQTNDMLVASLLRLPDNSCDVEESEKILMKFKKFNELFLLYERKQMHDAGKFKLR